MTIHWKAVEQYFSVVLFVFQFYPVWNFGIFFNFGQFKAKYSYLKTSELIMGKTKKVHELLATKLSQHVLTCKKSLITSSLDV